MFCDLNNIFINLINILKLRGLTMDASQYEKIADKLMQFRNKIPKNNNLADHKARMTCDHMKIKIDSLLMYIDEFAKLDEAGWIK